MFATLLFLAIAALSIAVIGATVAKGLAAASLLRRRLALCSDTRLLTVRHERVRARPAAMARPSRHPARPSPVPVARSRERVAA
jgi:hypothetical protein